MDASLITFGLYWKHLQEYRKHFPDDQILVVFLEDFEARPERELSHIYRHVGVDPSFVPDEPERKRNAADQYRKTGVVADLIRRISRHEGLRPAVPEPVVRVTKLPLTDEFDPSPEWEKDALEAVHGHFRSDSRNLLRYCGKPVDFWSFRD